MDIKLGELMVEFENGEITEADEIKLFKNLVDSGLVWKLQGFYGRYAQKMIEEGIIDNQEQLFSDIIDQRDQVPAPWAAANSVPIKSIYLLVTVNNKDTCFCVL